LNKTIKALAQGRNKGTGKRRNHHLFPFPLFLGRSNSVAILANGISASALSVLKIRVGAVRFHAKRHAKEALAAASGNRILSRDTALSGIGNGSAGASPSQNTNPT
jgi:hypothetical protein